MIYTGLNKLRTGIRCVDVFRLAADARPKNGKRNWYGKSARWSMRQANRQFANAVYEAFGGVLGSAPTDARTGVLPAVSQQV
jgi:hypothetical protein